MSSFTARASKPGGEPSSRMCPLSATTRQAADKLANAGIEIVEASPDFGGAMEAFHVLRGLGYATNMRSNTQGRATFSMHFAHYDEAQRAVTEEIVAKVQGKPAAR